MKKRFRLDQRVVVTKQGEEIFLTDQVVGHHSGWFVGPYRRFYVLPAISVAIYV